MLGLICTTTTTSSLSSTTLHRKRSKWLGNVRAEHGASNQPLRVTLEFTEVTYFESIPGDFSLLKSESFCLSSFGYCTDEDWGKSQFWVERAPEPDWAWSFQFQSKQEFRIRGTHASIKVEH